MSTTRRSIAEDLQGSRPAAPISLTGAGVTRSAKAIRIRHNREEKLFHAEIASFCDLGPDQKGVHMSRFEETVNEAIDEVVIGGTHVVGEYSVEPDPAVEAAIIARASEFFPWLADAPITSRAVGLRPGRDAVRLERIGDVIHCYGHGGSGVTIAFGCAEEVVALAAR